ncbi:endospore germination permease [Paenibacillus sp. HN-1]|uniref:GerAB/ArcD/ProY family transporter n=1 Tax=Paenibacillus TaxID=44249 RepID=UPI001CA7D660|nr:MULTISPECIES: endospore germination permease [Paenibacillus]MBY9080621.1 endospore germination permease [Paenibacillus sp. CGMCC 1.18879]MBY9085434.1 endospore germination permease [Paenibacillus sinensis]
MNAVNSAAAQTIGTRQIALLLIYVIVGDNLFLLPTVVASSAGASGWISVLSGMPVGILTIWLMYTLCHKYPGSSLMEISRTVLGKWAGSLVAAWYLVYFMMGAAIILREAVDFINTQVLTDTPMRFIMFTGTVSVSFAVMKGIEPIARSAEIFFYTFMAGLLLMLLLTTKDIDTGHILPLMGKGPMHIAEGTMYSIGFPFCESSFLMMMFPFIRQGRNTRRDLLIAGLIGGSMLLLVVLWCLLVLGPYYTGNELYPSYILAQTVNIGHFLERVEVILAINWMFGVFFKCTVYQFSFMNGLARLCRLQDEKPLVIPGAFLLFGLAYMISPNITYYMFTINLDYTYWDIMNGILIPLILLAVSGIRSKRSKAKSGSQA